jgi:hypothetical protein
VEQIEGERRVGEQDEQEREDDEAEHHFLAGGQGLLLPSPAGAGARLREPAGRVVAGDGGGSGVDRCGHRAVAVARLEPGGEDFADDARGRDVRERTFEAIAHLEADGAVVGEKEEDEAIVLSSAAHAPGLEGLDREVLDGNALGAAADPHQYLVAGLLLVGLEPGIQGPPRGLGQEGCAVRHPASGGRRDLAGRKQRHGEKRRGRGYEGRGMSSDAADHQSRETSRTGPGVRSQPLPAP